MHIIILLCLSIVVFGAERPNGLAAGFKHDHGIDKHPAVLFFDNFEKKSSPLKNDGRSFVSIKNPVSGTTVLASHNKKGKHAPWDTHHPVKKTEVMYYRFYSMFEETYDFGGGVKGPGISANAKGRPGGKAGIKPKGTDRYSARVCFNRRGEPYVYYYHMDMGQWGSNANQNIGSPIAMKPGQWYCIEMMLKPNTPSQKDGELKLWINGELKMHKPDIRWRTVSTLQLNWINHSAYFGGSWTSPKDQIRYEDNIVAASTYIGPAGKGSPKKSKKVVRKNKKESTPRTSRQQAVQAQLQSAFASYQTRLQQELDKQLSNGLHIYFTYSMLRKEIQLQSKTAKGYTLRSGNSDITLNIWRTFTPADAESLAIGLSARGKEEAHALAAFFVTYNKGIGAATKYLNKAGDKASEIKSLLK